MPSVCVIVWLIPVKEVNAAEKRVSNGFSTRANETMEMTGGDFYANVEQLKKEEEKMKEVREIAKKGTETSAKGTKTE